MLIERIEKKGRERWLTGETKSGEGVQKVDGELTPVVGDGVEDMDAIQKGSASSKTWSASLISSYVEIEERLEETAVLASSRILNHCGFEQETGMSRCARERERD
jgi:hypothetical protein